QDIAETAAQRHFGMEGAAPQHQRLAMLAQAGPHAFDILGMMLSIGVGGHDPGQSRKRAERVVDAGLQRRAFAQIDRVAQHLDPGDLRRPLEDGAVPGPAAVVHQQDGWHAPAGQVAHQIDQPGGRLVSGDEDYLLDGLFGLHGSRLRGSAGDYFSSAVVMRACARAMASCADPGSTPRAGFKPSSWARWSAARARCRSISSARSAASASTRTWSSSTSTKPSWMERYRFLPSATDTYVSVPMPSSPSSGAWPGRIPMYPSLPGTCTSLTCSRTNARSGVATSRESVSAMALRFL